ncbi:hypothetical protein [Agrobacterium radiobacter]|uniref:hypothetical protein n=1 Tax=Agrobacterium radiobacter TaxID=362 RepID=UPI003CF24986
MTKNQKRLNLAVAVMTVTHLILENVNAVLDLLSKVVNYRGPHIRKLQTFVLEERQAHLRAQ